MAQVKKTSVVYEIHTDTRGSYTVQSLRQQVVQLDPSLPQWEVEVEEYHSGTPGENFIIAVTLPVTHLSAHERLLRLIVALLENQGLIAANNTSYEL